MKLNFSCTPNINNQGEQNVISRSKVKVKVQMYLNHNISQTNGQKELVLTCGPTESTMGNKKRLWPSKSKIKVIVQMHLNHNISQTIGSYIYMNLHIFKYEENVTVKFKDKYQGHSKVIGTNALKSCYLNTHIISNGEQNVTVTFMVKGQGQSVIRF